MVNKDIGPIVWNPPGDYDFKPNAVSRVFSVANEPGDRDGPEVLLGVVQYPVSEKIYRSHNSC